MKKIGEVKLFIAKKISKRANLPLIDVLRILIQFNYDSKKTLKYILEGGR